MNCSDWQMRIAAEDPAGAEHVSGCHACREFARELSENAVALRSIVVDEAAYTAMRARVMEAVQAKRRSGWLWGAAAAFTACMALVWLAATLRVPEASHPQAVTYRIAPPESQVAVVPRMVKKRAKRGQETRSTASDQDPDRRPERRDYLAGGQQKRRFVMKKLMVFALACAALACAEQR